MKKMLAALLATVMVCVFSVNVFAEGSAPAKDNAEYLYNVTTNDNQWAEFTSKSQMVEATRIPDGVLKRLSTEQLVKAVLSYPLLVNIYAYDSYQQGLEALAEDSDAFRELLKRADAGDKLLQKLNTRSMVMSETSLEILTVSVLLSEESIWRTLENKETAKMALAASSTTVKTPKGTSVPVIIRGEELSLLQKSQMNRAFMDTYPQATYVSTSTTNYNCHSYAWYSDTTSNTYWMNDPSAYMTDGSYTSFTNLINAVIGTRVYYDNGEHSGIVYQAGGPLASPKYLQVVSKWGQAPLMKHKAEYSPYASDNLTMWKKS